jgi:hypothetical protein
MVHITPVEEFGIDPIIGFVILEFCKGRLNQAQDKPG